jgi:molecular chaperone GrpE
MTKEKNTALPTEDGGLEEEETTVEMTTESEQPESGKQKKKDRKDKEKLQTLEAEVAELKDKYLRLFAEFDNYKKRTIREKLDLIHTAAQDTLASILPVLDDFDRAKKIADDPSTKEKFSDGVLLVYQKLNALLRQMGLQEMESTGADFDAELHDAITEIPAAADNLKGKVVDTIEKGYYLRDKIIRHAKVVVGR